MGNLFRLLLVSFMGGFLYGCAAPQFNYLPEMERFSLPPINKVSEVGLGEYLLDQGEKTVREELLLERDVKTTLGKALAGSYKKVGVEGSYHYYAQDMSKGVTLLFGLAEIPRASGYIKFNKKTNELCLISIEGNAGCGVTIARFIKKSDQSAAGFRRTLIYNGKVGNKLTLGYREFSGGLARAAFNNTVEYDLKESKVIGYAGARIEVIDATNTSIKYRVLQNFNAL